MAKEIFVVSSPRSGNTWLGRLLGDALDSPLQAWEDTVVEYFGEGQDGDYVIRKTHNAVHQANWDTSAPIIFLQRDPRDLVISRLFYNNFEFSETVLMDFIRHLIALPPEFVYKTWVRDWQNYNVTFYTSYEALHLNKGIEIQNILKAIGVEITLKRAQEVFEYQSFDNIQSRYSDRFVGSMRKGVAGDWQNYFTRKSGEYITDMVGKLMLEQNYISDINWWKELNV